MAIGGLYILFMVFKELQAFNLGFDAYRQNKELEDNPFQEGTFEYQNWDIGWTVALDKSSTKSHNTFKTIGCVGLVIIIVIMAILWS